MSTHGVELNGGIALSTFNHGTESKAHPQYNGLSTFSYASGTIYNGWVKILDANFQATMDGLLDKDKTLTKMTATFLCSPSNAHTASQGVFLLNIVFKYKNSSTPHTIISSIDIIPISHTSEGLYARAILAYKPTNNTIVDESNVQCFVYLPFPYYEVRMTPVAFHTSCTDVSKYNPVGDAYFFSEQERLQGLFGVQTSNIPVAYLTMVAGLTGYTIRDTNKYIPKNGYNVISCANNKGNLALTKGFGSNYVTDTYATFDMSTALTYTEVFNCFRFKNPNDTLKSPVTTDIQLYYAIPSTSLNGGVYTATMYCMSDSPANIDFSLYDSGLIRLENQNISPENGSFNTMGGLNFERHVKTASIPVTTGNTLRLLLGKIPKNVNFYFMIKLELGYNSTDYSPNPND